MEEANDEDVKGDVSDVMNEEFRSAPERCPGKTGPLDLLEDVAIDGGLFSFFLVSSLKKGIVCRERREKERGDYFSSIFLKCPEALQFGKPSWCQRGFL